MDIFDETGALTSEYVDLLASAEIDPASYTWGSQRFRILPSRSQVIHRPTCGAVKGKTTHVIEVTVLTIGSYRQHHCHKAAGFVEHSPRINQMLEVATVVRDVAEMQDQTHPTPVARAQLAARVNSPEFTSNVTAVDGHLGRIDTLNRELDQIKARWLSDDPVRLRRPFVTHCLTMNPRTLDVLGLPRYVAARLVHNVWEAWVKAIGTWEGAPGAARTQAHAEMREQITHHRRCGERVPDVSDATFAAVITLWESDLDALCRDTTANTDVLVADRWFGKCPDTTLALIECFPSVVDDAQLHGIIRCPATVADWYAKVSGSHPSARWLDDATDADTVAVMECFVGMWTPKDPDVWQDPREILEAARRV